MIKEWDPAGHHFVQDNWEGVNGCVGECRFVPRD
jgi:hypothetical protein